MTITKKRSGLILLLVMLLTVFGAIMPTLANDDGDLGKTDFKINSEGDNFSFDIDNNSRLKQDDGASAWESLFVEYRNFIVGISGIGAISMIAFFILNFMKLGASAGNSKARGEAIVGLIVTGIAAAGLGAVTIIVGFFYNAI